MSDHDIIINISEQADIKLKNDLINFRFSVESSLYDDSNKSYDSIIDIVNKINIFLKKEKVDNIQIYFNSNQIIDYGKERKILGYKTIANINFESIIENKNDIRDITKIQNYIISLTNKDANILIEPVQYLLRNETKKKGEIEAIKKAIMYAKLKASIIAKTLDSDKFIIKELNINTNSYNRHYNEYSSVALQKTSSERSIEIISEGFSNVSSTANMKISVSQKL